MKYHSKAFFTELFINKFILKRRFFLFKVVFSVNYFLYAIYPQFYPQKQRKKE